MSYQNINQYNFKKWFLTPIYDSYDISLASDEKDYNEEVIFSDAVIANNDGNKLPIHIDLNFSGSNQTIELNFGEYNYDNIIVTKNVYNPTFSDLTVFSSQTLCDIGLTGIDNGLVSGMTGQSITITNGVNQLETFNRNYFDKRFKMIQVTGHTSPPNQRFSGLTSQTIYEMVSYTGETEGIYNELYGGFYQGFFKLFDFDYECFPNRFNKGWSVEMVLKPRLVDYFSGSTGQTYLNTLYPDNKDIFFYLGTRAENKFYHLANGHPISNSGYTRVTESLNDCLYTCSCSDTGVTNSRCISVYQQSAQTINHEKYCQCGCVNSINTAMTSGDKDPIFDTISNAISFKLCGPSNNPKIGIRVLRFTGDCIVTGTTPNTGITYQTGYTITDYCSDDGIYDYCDGTEYLNDEHWFLIDVVWERNTWLDTCDLYYRGGLGLITKFEYLDSITNNSVLLIKEPNVIPTILEVVRLNERWLIEKNDRKGKLKIYVNGKIFYTIDNFEEIIPRGLDTEKEKQIGVPFNISWGGGALGLHENLTFSSCTSENYIQDPECLPNNILSGTTLSGLTTNILLEQNFGGTFDGAISQFRFYIEPINSSEVKHNFKILRDKFIMFDPDCPNC
jgi:hypothetical protein